MKVTTLRTNQLATLALVALLVSEVDASKKFVKLIPNGGNVPDTPAIGHSDGIGEDPSTNAFGDAFSAAGKKWTKELCEADTDGDGQTNGQELGDPCCEWDKDTNPVVLWTTWVSHPDDASKTSDPSLWANMGGTSTSSTTESMNTTDSTSTESTGSATGSSSSMGSGNNHNHGSEMHGSNMVSSSITSISGSSSSPVEVGSPSTSSDNSRANTQGTSIKSSTASSANTPSASSSSSSTPATSGASAATSVLAAGVVAVVIAFFA